MEIKKENSNITYIRKTTETDFTLTNAKGEELKLTFVCFVSDGEYDSYDCEETFLDVDRKEIESIEEVLLNFMGCPEDSDNEPETDPDDILDELKQLAYDNK